MLSLVSTIGAYLVQSRAETDLPPCSYLDPIAVDILAFLAALFLIVEGFYRIYEHRDDRFVRQLTRAIRVAFGCSIVTLHVMQYLHK
jgi:divalent metal cation (Fe/Co/Zn/Cd) transporter